MTATHDLEGRLADFYAAEAPSRAPDWVLATALATIDDTPQRRVLVRVPWSFRAIGATRARFLLAVLALVALAAAGLALAGSLVRPQVPEPLTWTPERYAQDWPGPVRLEPSSGAPDVLLVRGDRTHWDPAERAWEGLEHVDPVGDIGPGARSWIDIRTVGGPGAGLASYSIGLAAPVPFSAADPHSRWIAYGIVIDTNGDGIADERLGIDNTPDGSHRAWVTDLATGRTRWKVGPPYGSVGDDGGATGRVGLDTYHPGEEFVGPDQALLRYSGPGGRYYAWASIIEDGRVVATDYAPDVGWLVQPEDPGLPLVGTTWSVGRDISSDLSIVATLTITDEGQLLFDAGCRTGTADVVVESDAILVSNLSLSGDQCRTPGGLEFESEILSMLSSGEIAYLLDRGVLELRAGQEMLRLDGTLEDPP